MESPENKAVRLGRTLKTQYEGQLERVGDQLLARIGEYQSVQRFLSRYGKVSSRTAALFHLNRYLAWLKAKGVGMTPDELITDNLQCVYESSAVDVARKRKHTDWLNEFVNTYLKDRKIADISRAMSASFAKRFYEANDSKLFGDFGVSLDKPVPPPPPLDAGDIRAVLKALPLAQRLPLLFVWQSGTEINRVLSLTWGDVKGKGYPLKLEFFGRKRHRRNYSTYLGRDSTDGLKLWREELLHSLPEGANQYEVHEARISLVYLTLDSASLQIEHEATPPRTAGPEGCVELEDAAYPHGISNWFSMSGYHTLSAESRADVTTIRVTKDIRGRLQALKRELGFRNLNALFNYTILELTKGQTIPPAEYSVIFERLGTKPVIMTGESGAGKTTAVRELLSRWSGSVFILDVTNEYPDLGRVDLGQIFSRKWEKGGRFRFVSNPNVEASKGEASAIFSHLNYLKNAGALREWVIVVEEGHRFSQDANLRALLIEGRKFARKVILVTTDWRTYEGIARVFKPRLWVPPPHARTEGTVECTRSMTSGQT